MARQSIVSRIMQCKANSREQALATLSQYAYDHDMYVVWLEYRGGLTWEAKLQTY